MSTPTPTADQTSSGSMCTAEIKDHIAAMFADRPEPAPDTLKRRRP